MKVIGYLRVSTDEQAEKGVSIEAQAEKIRQWASLGGHEVVGMHSDPGVSGKATRNRPGVLAAITQAIETKGILVVYSLSRMSRSTADTIRIVDQLAASGAEFVSVTEQFDTTTPMGRAFYKIIATLAELEREQIVDRTLEAMAFKRRNGEALGHAPFGFRNETPGVSGGKLIEHPEEMKALRRMLSLADELGSSYAEIARELDRAGHFPRNGSGWDRGVVRRIVLFYRTGAGINLLERAPIQGGTNGAAHPVALPQRKE